MLESPSPPEGATKTKTLVNQEALSTAEPNNYCVTQTIPIRMPDEKHVLEEH
jgi:hypothetical protein